MASKELSPEELKQAAEEAGISPFELRQALAERDGDLVPIQSESRGLMKAPERGLSVAFVEREYPSDVEQTLGLLEASLRAQGLQGHRQGDGAADFRGKDGLTYRLRVEAQPSTNNSLARIDLDPSPQLARQKIQIGALVLFSTFAALAGSFLAGALPAIVGASLLFILGLPVIRKRNQVDHDAALDRVNRAMLNAESQASDTAKQ